MASITFFDNPKPGLKRAGPTLLRAQRGGLRVSERDLPLKISEWFCNGMPAEPLWQLSCEGPVPHLPASHLLSTVEAQSFKDAEVLSTVYAQEVQLLRGGRALRAACSVAQRNGGPGAGEVSGDADGLAAAVLGPRRLA